MGAAENAATPLDRVISAAAKTPEWKAARDQAERLQALRQQALKYAAESEVPSDRYVITALAGPVDLVRFFGLAKTVCSGTAERRAALQHQWRREKAGSLREPNPPADAELYPDDLPSNALGALFGEEVRPHNKDLGYDLVGVLQKFFAPLEPVADSVTAKFSYEQLLHGLAANASAESRRLSRSWATAEPLYLLPVIAPERTKTLPNAAAALKAAGLEVRVHEGQPMVIDRIGAAEVVTEEVPLRKTAPGVVMQMPRDETPPPAVSTGKAVPLPDYPKAVPLPEPRAKKKTFPKAVPLE